MIPTKTPAPKITSILDALEAANNIQIRDFVMHPSRYIIQMTQWLSPEQLMTVDFDQAVSVAEERAERLADHRRGSGQGWGSSDRTWEMVSYIKALGFSVERDDTDGFTVGDRKNA